MSLQLLISKLSTPKFAIVGKLVMKKHVSIFEVDKGLKSIWNVVNAMETTLIGDNLYCFIFQNENTVERIMDNQPWDFRGSLVLLDRINGDECPTEMALHTGPFWIQFHGLQLRAMNKAVGEDVGALIGEVLEINCDDEGQAIGQCLRVRVCLDIIKPLVRWTNINIGGFICKVLFRYKKLADYCYVCGSLTHLEKHCPIAHPNGLRFYGPWLQANGNNLIVMYDISCELNRLNDKKTSPSTHSASPSTPNTRDLFTPSPSIPAISSSKITKRVPYPYLSISCFRSPRTLLIP